MLSNGVNSRRYDAVRIRTNGIICCEKFAEVPQLGRFTLRDEGKTVAIGKVLKLKPYVPSTN